MPLTMRPLIVSSEAVEGPSVQTILVLGLAMELPSAFIRLPFDAKTCHSGTVPYYIKCMDATT